MKITVIGTGYVGLVSGVCYAELGNDVICIDNDINKIDKLNQGEVPIYEPGLQHLVKKNSAEGRLQFHTNLKEAVKASEIIIIAVGTPSLPSGEANLYYIEQVAHEIAGALDEYKIICIKSTVPVGTNERIRNLILDQTEVEFDSISLPEFLREGCAIQDTLVPDRIVIGAENERAATKMKELHHNLTRNIVITDIRSAEMIKYASNAFLATKISFINEIANICEKVGADITKVTEGMGYDKRIGSSFLKAGIGYGGSCFPKDTQALIQIAGQMDYDFKLLKSVVEVNKGQRFNIIHKLEQLLGNLSGKTIGVWGLAFKPETDDVRDAPSIEIISSILERGGVVKAYDPIAIINFKEALGNNSVIYCSDAKEAAQHADALCILTEWKEFEQISLKDLECWLKSPNLIDGRNIYNEEDVAGTQLAYYSVGRPNMNKGIREQIPVLML
ncbi:MAG: UDP-glucose dehydrogenase family protein [Bacillota bacterium]